MVQRVLTDDTVYCIDTSALINLWREPYAPDIFPGIRKDIEGLVRDGRLVAPSHVYAELEVRDDDLHDWAKAHKRMFRRLDEDDLWKVSRILRQFPTLIDAGKDTEDADPFLIALAMDRGWCVVTSERSGGARGRPRIPNVCRHFGLRCIGLMDLFREQGWRYDRG